MFRFGKTVLVVVDGGGGDGGSGGDVVRCSYVGGYVVGVEGGVKTVLMLVILVLTA